MSEPDLLRIGAGVPMPAGDAAAPPPASPGPNARRLSRPLIIAASVALVAVVGGLAWLVFAGSPLESAKQACAPDSAYAVIGDGGDSLVLRSEGRRASGLSAAELRCFMAELEVTDAIMNELGTTRALDGRQGADWDGYHATWTYHPDSGLAMVVTVS
jgi:hypothetical protein